MALEFQHDARRWPRRRPQPPGGGRVASAGGPKPPPRRPPAKRPDRGPSKSPPDPIRAPSPPPEPREPAAEGIVIDLRGPTIDAPLLVGATRGTGSEAAGATTTTTPRSSLPRRETSPFGGGDAPGDEAPLRALDDALETTGTTGGPLALDQALEANEPQVPRPTAVTEPATPTVSSRRRAWPQVRFYLGAVALFFISFAFATGMWVVGPIVVLGWEPVAITSGSMAPAIRQGDVVVFSQAPTDPVGPGSVIVFEDRHGSLVTHRVTATLDDGRYITRGDNNPVDDSTPVPADSVRGVGRVLVPYAGYPAVWTAGRTWPMLLVVAATLGSLAYISRWAILSRFDPWAPT